MYKLVEKRARLGQTPDPLVDPESDLAEIEAVETLFLGVLREQREAAASVVFCRCEGGSRHG